VRVSEAIDPISDWNNSQAPHHRGWPGSWAASGAENGRGRV